ncbi:NAD(P)H-hydrate dehydratase [Psychromonas sp. MME2]|uniref:NAD(P)H-hydrate dehydratase n=1 Tax=unclassified Psychromonas TaxID=2614957 RepID=UPI00339BC659
MYSEQIKTRASLPQTLYHSQQIKIFESKAAMLSGVTLYGLMQRAGEACLAVLKMHFCDAKQILIFTGKGNNGGDGYILAQLAKQAGLSVQLCQMGSSYDLRGDAAIARDSWLAAGGCIESVTEADFSRADLLVDALLGTGFTGELRPEYQILIEQINESSIAVLSVDLPSGLDANCGTLHSHAVKAQATVSFVGLKQGLFTGHANDYCGQIYFTGLGISAQFSKLASSEVSRIGYQELCVHLLPRSRYCHKGMFGRVLLVGGNLGMSGAVRLAGEAALRSGAGLVKILTRVENQGYINIGCPELMVIIQEQQKNFMDWPTHLVIGPGLGQDVWAQQLFKLITMSELPCVVDADALNLLAENNLYKNNWVLTPHPGEAAKLLACTVQDIEADRFAAVRKIQRRFGGIVILKGAGSLICDHQHIYVANVGNPGMASGGMGDLLSGIIVALLAQGLNPLVAVQLAVCLHGEAGDLAARYEQRGLLASDLFPYIKKLVNPKCLNYLQKNYKMQSRPSYLADD